MEYGKVKFKGMEFTIGVEIGVDTFNTASVIVHLPKNLPPKDLMHMVTFSADLPEDQTIEK